MSYFVLHLYIHLIFGIYRIYCIHMKNIKTVRVNEDTYKRLVALKAEDMKVHGCVISFDTAINDLLDFLEEKGEYDHPFVKREV